MRKKIGYWEEGIVEEGPTERNWKRPSQGGSVRFGVGVDRLTRKVHLQRKEFPKREKKRGGKDAYGAGIS